MARVIGKCVAQLVDTPQAMERANEWMHTFDQTVHKTTPQSEDQEVIEDSMRRQMMYRVRDMMKDGYSSDIREIYSAFKYHDDDLIPEGVDWDDIAAKLDILAICQWYDKETADESVSEDLSRICTTWGTQ